MIEWCIIGILLLFSVDQKADAEPALQVLKSESEVYHQTEQAKRSILSQLYSLNANIMKLQREQDGFERRGSQAETEVANLGQLVAHLSKQTQSQRARLLRRIQILQQFGGRGTIQLIFQTQSTSDLDRELRVLKKVVGIDYSALVTYRDQLRDLERQQSALASKQNRLGHLLAEIEDRALNLKRQIDEKSRLVGQIDSKQVIRLTRMKRLRLEASQDGSGQSLGRKLANLEALLVPSFLEKRGQLTAPFSGSLVSKFGLQPESDRDDTIRIRNHGVTWRSKATTDVASISDGSVIFSGIIEGFGQTLVIDHGEHYYSVYAHLVDVLVENGQKIQAGERLGGTDTLYFEIRHFSNSEDPEHWLKR